MLFVPGTRPDRFAGAITSGADAVIIDLEDSVEPGRKAEARAAIVEFFSQPVATTVACFVRVNTFGSPLCEADLASVGAIASLEGIVLPKVEAPADVSAVARAVAPRCVLPLIETARGVLNALAIAEAAGPVPAILFGAEDLTAQVGIPRTIDGEELIFARSQVVLAATAVGADPIDAVLIDIMAAGDLRRDALRARALGFRGKLAIHPGQVPVIHEVFSPSPAELGHARRIVDAFDRAQAQGEAVIRLDDRMIDMPVVIRARRILNLKT